MSNNEIINFYEKIPKKFVENKMKNPNFKNHGLKDDFMGLVCGSTGSMKTNFVLNLIYRNPDWYSKIVLFIKNEDEPLYKFLKETLGKTLQIVNSYEELPPLESLDKSKHYLVIFDDVVLDSTKDQKKISEYYIKARKMGCSCLYLTQSYYDVPRVIRNNNQYIFIKKIPQATNLLNILREYNLGVSKEQLFQMYRQIQEKPEDCLVIDVNEPDLNKRFRRNFLEAFFIN